MRCAACLAPCAVVKVNGEWLCELCAGDPQSLAAQERDDAEGEAGYSTRHSAASDRECNS